MLLIPIRYPSGADLATCAKPNSPEAPGLLLTTTGTPSRLDRCSASVRAVVSVPPPAANPTTSSIGFSWHAGPPVAGGPGVAGGPCAQRPCAQRASGPAAGAGRKGAGPIRGQIRHMSLLSSGASFACGPCSGARPGHGGAAPAGPERGNHGVVLAAMACGGGDVVDAVRALNGKQRNAQCLRQLQGQGRVFPGRIQGH